MKPLELIGRQIAKGREIIESIIRMRELPSSAVNVTAYIDEEVNMNRKSMETWQYVTRDIIASIYGDCDVHVKDFDRIVSQKIYGFNYKEEFHHMINQGLSVLEAIEENIKMSDDSYKKNTCKIRKRPKIFISHKTEDKDFANELVRLMEYIIGNDPNNILCSSIGGYDLKPGDEILKELKRQFYDYDVQFIIIHSPRYYTSPICLNEMGAAWILGTDFYSFLTPDCDFSMLKGVIDGKYLSVKVNDSLDIVISKLNSFKDILIDKFSINRNGFNSTRWESIRNEFIERTSEMSFDTTVGEKGASSKGKQIPSADISVELTNRNPYVISVINRGYGTAEKLTITLDKECEGMLISGLDNFPVDFLKHNRHIELTVYPCIGDPTKLKLFFEWEENSVKFKSEDIIFL